MIDTADLPHVDEVRAMRRSEAMAVDQAVDDEGRTYRVGWNNWANELALYPQMTTEERLAREGCGEPCAACEEPIGQWDIILNDKTGATTEHYHLRCYDQEGAR